MLISGNLPFKTEAASVFVFNHIQSGDQAGAAAVAVVMTWVALKWPMAAVGVMYVGLFLGVAWRWPHFALAAVVAAAWAEWAA